MEELKKQLQSKTIKFDYLEKNPFEIRTVHKNIKITINYNEILEFIKEKDPEFYNVLTNKEQKHTINNSDAENANIDV